MYFFNATWYGRTPEDPGNAFSAKQLQVKVGLENFSIDREDNRYFKLNMVVAKLILSFFFFKKRKFELMLILEKFHEKLNEI